MTPLDELTEAINRVIHRIEYRWLKRMNDEAEYYLGSNDDFKKRPHFCYVCMDEIKYPGGADDTFTVDWQYQKYWWTCSRRFCQECNKSTKSQSIENEIKDMFDDLD